MKDRIGFFNKIIISVANVKRYKELINEKLSRAIIYSILFSLIIGSAIGGFSYAAISSMQKSIENIMSTEELKFTLENGVLDFENSPLKYEEGQNIIYIDTSLSLSDVNNIRKIVVHKDFSVSFLKDGISYRANGEEYNYKYTEMNLVDKIDNNDFINSLGIFSIIKYIVFILSILMTYLNFMFNAFILSILGVILNKINYLNLGYGNILKICIYATTLSTILGSFINLGAFSMLISGTYLTMVINNLRREVEL
ncbi:DUF1189 family protein [Clostridium sp.]|uniref:DUF1189 family protein n=1 Tax=Clostridium sp. TaxID=1506 RepID=UPI001DB1D3F2|nr:DUF1189 family protein [Clostridium sp.]MBS5938101.1 DUF1189 domain-containing protein [Clostridium sp.]